MLAELAKESARKLKIELDEAISEGFEKFGYKGGSREELFDFMESIGADFKTFSNGFTDRYVCFDVNEKRILFEIETKAYPRKVDGGVVVDYEVIKKY